MQWIYKSTQKRSFVIYIEYQLSTHELSDARNSRPQINPYPNIGNLCDSSANYLSDKRSTRYLSIFVSLVQSIVGSVQNVFLYPALSANPSTICHICIAY